MKENKCLQILNDVKALMRGHFVYNSMLHGIWYANKDALYPHTAETCILAREMAERLSRLDIDTVLAPAVGGVILSQWVSYHLSKIGDKEVMAVYAERDEDSVLKADEDTLITISVARKDAASKKVIVTSSLRKGDELFIKKPEFILKRGYGKFVKDKNVLVVEDVVNTGGSIKRVIDAAKAIQGRVVAAACLYNRGGITAHDLGVPIFEVLVTAKLEAWTAEECAKDDHPCHQNIPIDTDVGKGREYLARQKNKS